MFLWFLSELRNLYDNVIPEMNGDINEENEIFRAELDAVSREIELREERIKELKDRRTKLVHCSKVHKVHSFSLYCLLVPYGSAFTLQPSVTVSEPQMLTEKLSVPLLGLIMMSH
jgi:hypothetical protein